MSFTVKMLHQ